MQSQFVLYVSFAFIGCALSAAVDSAPKSLDAAPLNTSPELKNDLLVEANEAQAQLESVEGDSSDLDSSAPHSRPSRFIFGYPHHYHRSYYTSYPIYGGYYPVYGGYYPTYGGYYGGWHGHHGHHGHRRYWY